MVYNPIFSFKKRKTVTITAGTALPAGYQVKLTIPLEAEMQATFNDIRFQTMDGRGLSYWIESVVSTTATVWIRLIDTVGASATVNIYIYYGNPYAASASNGTNVFIFFDDFNDGDISDWVDSGSTYDSYKALDTTHTSSPPYSLLIMGYRASGGCWYDITGRFKKTVNLPYGSYKVDMYVYRATNCSYSISARAYVDTTQLFNVCPYDGTRSDSFTGAITDIILESYWYGCTGGADSYFDDVRIRKGVATEPAAPTIGATAKNVYWNPQRKRININTTTATPANYQIKITVSSVPEMNNDFSDLRFISKTGTNLDYWIESSTVGVTADVWVELTDAIGTSSSDYIYIYYGNPNLTSASNGVNTFDFFDDFESGSVASWIKSDVNCNVSSYLTAVSSSPLSGTYSLNINGEHSGNWATASVEAYKNIILASGSKVLTAKYITYDGSCGSGYPSVNKLKANDVEVYTGCSNTATTVTSSSFTDSGSVKISLWIQRYAVNFTFQAYYDDVRIRKYIATEPTIDSTAIAESMSLFTRRKKLTINNNSGTSLTDYQVPITVTWAPAMQTNFNDMRFVDANGNLLPYWIESIAIIASDSIQYSSDSQINAPSTTYTLLKSISIAGNHTGSCRITFDLSQIDYTAYGQIYKNGVALGTERSGTNSYTEDFSSITLNDGETIELWGHKTNVGTCTVSNFRIKFNSGISATVWIKTNLPNYGTTPTGDNTVYMYYGNANVASESDGNTTFDFFDDFIGSSLTQKWTVDSNITSYSVASSKVTVSGVSESWGVVKGIHANFPLVNGYIVEIKDFYWYDVGTNSVTIRGLALYPTSPANWTDGNVIEIDDSWAGGYGGYETYINEVNGRVAYANTAGQTGTKQLKISKDSSNYVKMYFDGVEQTGSSTNADATTQIFLLINAYGSYPWNGTASYDRVLARKYVATEPTVITGQEEHTRKGSIIVF